MRNLKRALSLTLASVMLLGMMVVGSSAAKSYPDVSEEDNIEAIEVLQAVKVMVGDENGNFGPEQPVNRSQMAVVMALLLDLNYDYYQGTCPFWDVPSWAEPYVAACYANGIVSGYDQYVYGAADPVTAVQAASMMMRALGYFQYASDYADGFELSTVKQASKINLFDGINANATDALTRNQVARLALNALETPIVEANDNTINISSTSGDANVTITGGQVTYTVVASTQSFARAIDATETNSKDQAGRGGFTVELGEQLYNGKLKLDNDAIDDYGRPARAWENDGNAIGTYAKKELLREAYTEGIKGQDMYNLLGSAIVVDPSYSMDVYVDGAPYVAGATGYGRIIRDNFTRNNESSLDNTGRGVLTEVYVDGDTKEITIAIINTYLAQAIADYDTSRESLAIQVYDGNDTNKTLAAEDFPAIVNMQDGDFMLINWADLSTLAQNKKVTNVRDPEIMTDRIVTRFSASQSGDGTGNVTEVVTGGETYKSAKTLNYDTKALNKYDDGLLTDKTYDIYLDQYGNAIGVALHTGSDNYVFITGYDANATNIATANATAAAIFLDGTMDTISVDVKETNAAIEAYNKVEKTNTFAKWEKANEGTKINTWYTYTLDTTNGVYTLRPVKEQLTVDYTSTDSIRTDNRRLDGVNDRVSAPINGLTAYGNANSVYLTVDTDTINGKTNVISEVTGTFVGVGNVDISPRTDVSPDRNIFVVYDDDLYIIGAVVIGEDNGSAQNYYYIFEGAKWEEVRTETDARANSGQTYYWSFDAIDETGPITLEIKTKYQSVITAIKSQLTDNEGYDADEVWANGYLFKLNFDSNGYVTSARCYNDEALTTSYVFANDDGGWDTKIYNANKVVRYMNVGTSKTENPVDSLQINNYNTLYTDGHTLYNQEKVSSGDVGLGLAEKCVFVVVQDENGVKDVKSTHSTIKAALARLANCTDGTTAGSVKKFNGTISAVLNSAGEAVWVVFDSNSGFLPDTNNVQGGGDGKVSLDSRLSASVYGTITNDDVNTSVNGKTTATFDLKKPDWAYTDASNGIVSIDYEIWMDGEWYMDGTKTISRVANNTYDTYSCTLVVAGASGTDLTLGEVKEGTTLHSISLVITDIQWKAAKIEYYDSNGRELAMDTSSSNTSVYLTTDSSSATTISFKVNTADTTASTDYTYSIENAKGVGGAGLTNLTPSVQINQKVTTTGSYYAEEGKIVKVIINNDVKLNYTVTVQGVEADLDDDNKMSELKTAGIPVTGLPEDSVDWDAKLDVTVYNGMTGSQAEGSRIIYRFAIRSHDDTLVTNYVIKYTVTYNGTTRSETVIMDKLFNNTVSVEDIKDIHGDLDLTIDSITATLDDFVAKSADVTIDGTDSVLTITYGKEVAGIRPTSNPDVKTYISGSHGSAVVTDVKVEGGKLVITFGTAALAQGDTIIVDNIAEDKDSNWGASCTITVGEVNGNTATCTVTQGK